VVEMNNSLIRSFLLIIFIVAISLVNINAQFNDYTVKLGVQGNALLSDTEFDKELRSSDAEFKFSGLARLFLRFEFFTEALEAEVGGGFGKLAGVDFDNNNWWTYIFPLDFRFILSPLEMDVWNPYIYAGAGGMYFQVEEGPDNIPLANLPDKNNGWTGIFPVGAGFEIGISDAFIIDLSGGYTFTLSDDLNGYSNKDVEGTDQAYDGYYNIGIGFTFVNGYGASDKDEDGLTKREELEISTDPNNPDSDGDGLKDGEEVRVYITDPLNPDSDADALKDGPEVKTHGTDPSKADTDADMLTDGNEVNSFKTDPLDNDTDDDLLDDGKEVNKYKTDPLKADSDGDGLVDGNEINTHKTDPLKADTDGEGLNDGEEINTYRTDPLNADTDGGTVNDSTEVGRGTNPLDPADDVIKIDVPIVLEGITFATGKSAVTPESAVVLRGAIKTLTTYSDIIVEISGHTDNVGSSSSNQVLSQKRADSVRFWLISNGVDPDRIIAKGYGEEYPRVPNDSRDNKRMNRRIEFKRIR
jgi:outer membrane protein OmpA-like peptidoglycan-associated protein